MEESVSCKGGWKDLEVYFCDSAEEPTMFRVYESMYETMKDAFYGSTQMPVFVIGYAICEVGGGHMVGQVWHFVEPRTKVSKDKSFINMRNVTHIKVVGGSDGR